MTTFIVKVKWGKKKLEGVEINMAEPPIVFKSQLFTLTGVPPDRQKVMIAGTTVGDEDWGKSASKIKPNVMLMLMGSADALPQAPATQQKFIEDMSEAETMSALKIPVGLTNLGNTCYMNATLQCLKVVPELKDELQHFRMGNSDYVSHKITAALGALYKVMETGNPPDIQLLLFLKTLHAVVPHFAEKTDQGVYQQQDAHECWSTIMSNLSDSLQSRFMEKYFGVTFNTSYKCLESSEEMETSEIERGFQLSCFIGQDIKYLHTGLGKGLQGEAEKLSPSLGRNALYCKTSTITRLPAYLTVQFIRFHVGRAGASEEIVSKKILKDIQFPISNLDLYDLCSPDLQHKLMPARKRFKEVEDAKMAEKAKKIAEGPAVLKQSESSSEPVEYESCSFQDDLGSNNSGYYDLKAVLTHKGRSSNSGHYLGWVRRPTGDWIKYDDDDVSLVNEEDVKKLSGGGDWHIAYILLYASKRVEKLSSATT